MFILVSLFLIFNAFMYRLRFSLRVPTGSTTELSHKGQQFLAHMFERHDKDKDHALSPAELEDLFSACPTPAWGSNVSSVVATNEKGWITYQGYMCQWALMTLVDLPRAFEYFAYLGYNIYENESQLSAVQGREPLFVFTLFVIVHYFSNKREKVGFSEETI